MQREEIIKQSFTMPFTVLAVRHITSLVNIKSLASILHDT